jgi:hypothetical protein
MKRCHSSINEAGIVFVLQKGTIACEILELLDWNVELQSHVVICIFFPACFEDMTESKAMVLTVPELVHFVVAVSGPVRTRTRLLCTIRRGHS